MDATVNVTTIEQWHAAANLLRQNDFDVVVPEDLGDCVPRGDRGVIDAAG